MAASINNSNEICCLRFKQKNWQLRLTIFLEIVDIRYEGLQNIYINKLEHIWKHIIGANSYQG